MVAKNVLSRLYSSSNPVHLALNRVRINCPTVRTRLFSIVKDPPSTNEPVIPDYYPLAKPETSDKKRARLLYQSRKRGMLENDLLLSTFASIHLKSFGDRELEYYDHLINLPSNDWEIYYWIVGIKETPAEFHSPVMDLLKLHVKNMNKELRIRQPDLD